MTTIVTGNEAQFRRIVWSNNSELKKGPST
jgi:hypothetical protein